MISLKLKQANRNQGFTIVELLIVIVVIGILAALVITTYGGIQAKARNGKRASDIQSVQTQLEAFYAQNQFYPSLTDLNSQTWRATNMKSLDNISLVDPSSTCNPNTATTCVAAAAALKTYSYKVGDAAANASCEAVDTNCAQYILTASYEGTYNGSATMTKNNLD